jgi:N-acylneuraminate cytidylyltransferase
LFKGKPIIAYTIETVKASGIADTIMVSTDDEEIAKVAMNYGAEYPFRRKDETANDVAGVAEVLVEVVKRYEEIGQHFDYVLCVYATNPLLRPERLVEAMQRLQDTPSAESISTIEAYSYPPQRGMVIREDGFMVMNQPEYYAARSQDLPKLYHDSCQFFLFKTEALLRDRKLYTEHTLPFEIKESESQDIDTWEDWKLMEMKYDLMHSER